MTPSATRSQPLVLFLGRDSDAMVAAATFYTAERPGLAAQFWPELGPRRYPLHPSDHGDIADNLLVTSSRSAAGLVVVTHSDVIVLRCRLRIAEGQLPAGAVIVQWVSELSVVRPIAFDDLGNPDEWPPDLGAGAEMQRISEALSQRAPAASATQERP